MPAQSVATFLAALTHPRKPEIEALREIVLAADPTLNEQIKWNAPSFCHDGDDRITMRINPPSKLQLIFHRGAKVKSTDGFHFDDPTGTLTFAAPDRAILTIASMDDLTSRRAGITDLVRRWIAAAA